MTSNMRFGLEMEFHAIRLTFRQRGTDNYWAPATGNVLQEDTMISVDPILVPNNQEGYFDGNVPPSVQWESNWGFRAVGDAHGTVIMSPNGQFERDVGTCILELATPANRVDDAAYWINSRLCAKAFLDSINAYRSNTIDAPGQFTNGDERWYPLQHFLDNYNARVAGLPAREGFRDLPMKAKFQLQKSRQILDFENGTYPGHNQNWDAYINVRRDVGNADQWVDVQLTYQMGLRTLYNSLDQWVNTWASMWAWKVGPYSPNLDPNIGDSKAVAISDTYRLQTFAAMWRKAREYVDNAANFALPGGQAPNGVGVDAPLIRSLLMYLMVCSTITRDAESKNALPQLPKTSPASIARTIAGFNPAAQQYFANLANLVTVSGSEVVRAREFCKTSLRSKAVLADAPGNLPRTGPYPPQMPKPDGDRDPRQPFSENDYGILRTFPDTFLSTWTGTFQNNALTAGNKFGFIEGGPFYCMWSHDVNLSVPASVFNTGPNTGNDVKMVFESRYGRSKLNFGFNPYVRDFMFRRSYLSLVRLLGTPAENSRVREMVEPQFPDEPNVVQNFTAGPH